MIEKDLNKKVCEFNKYMRGRYFHGMLLDDKDFTTEQQYHIGKRKLINRMLHGWGVVCGLDIEWEKGKRSLKIMPGMALDCHGNEILVCEAVTVDLTQIACFQKKAAPKGPMTTEKCEQRELEDEPKECYIGICYNEKSAAPVPVYITGDECGKKECDHSRWKEGFCIDILDTCPDQYPYGKGIITRLLDCEPANGKNCQSTQQTDVEKDPEVICQEEFLKEYCKKPPPCPECCTEKQYVGLGKIVLNSEKTIQEVWINDCRRYVISGNLIRYLLSSTLTGLDGKYQLVKDGEPVGPVPDPNIIHGNPIKALCWILKHIYIDKGDIKEKDEEAEKPDDRWERIRQEFVEKNREQDNKYQKLRESQQLLKEAIEKSSRFEDFKDKLEKSSY